MAQICNFESFPQAAQPVWLQCAMDDFVAVPWRRRTLKERISITASRDFMILFIGPLCFGLCLVFVGPETNSDGLPHFDPFAKHGLSWADWLFRVKCTCS